MIYQIATSASLPFGFLAMTLFDGFRNTSLRGGRQPDVAIWYPLSTLNA